MKIDIKDLKEQVTNLDFSAKPEEIGFDGEAVFDGPIKVSVEIHDMSERYRVVGRVSAVAMLACGRCLKQLKIKLAPQFDIVHVKDAAEEEGEIPPGETDELAMEGDIIDIGEDVRQTILLELPMNPICGKTCKGLCQSCGTDLNKKKCGCDQPALNKPFAGIKNIIKKKK